MTRSFALGTLLVLWTCVGSYAPASAAEDSDSPGAVEGAPRSLPIDGGTRTERFSVASESLGENREIVVRLPGDYSSGAGPYPVLYVTDADWQFSMIAEYVEYLSFWKRIPPMLVVGILNVERNRDFVPRVDPTFPFTGEADRFLPFLFEELRSEVESRYRAGDFNVLFGHSFGGVLALHALFERPDAFDAYIAVGTSTWISDRVLFDEANAFFDAGKTTDAMVYLAIAEADGGPTVPVGMEFADLWKARAPASLEWSFRVEPETSHFTAVLPSLHRALDTLYPAWGFGPELNERLQTRGVEAIDEMFEEKRAALGPRFFPQTMELNELAYGLLAQDMIPEARALMARLRKEAPSSPELYSTSSYVEMMAGELELALDFARQAVALGHRTGHFKSRIVMYEQLRDEIERMLEEGGS